MPQNTPAHTPHADAERSEASGTPGTPSQPPPQQVWLNGQLVPAEQATVSVFDHGLLYGDGVFEGIRIYAGRIFKLHTHLTRLYQSARSIRLDIPYSPAELERACRDTAAANKRHDGYIRLVVTRGPGTLGLNPFTCHTPRVFIIASGITLYPPELYETGLSIITASTLRNHPAALSPRIKSLNYLNNILAKIEAIDAGAPEAVMLNHLGYVAECTADNLFLVRRPGNRSDAPPEVVTPPLHAGILEGVTRNVVMELARAEGIPVLETDLTKHDLYTADEALLTGTAAEVIAITQIDARPIGPLPSPHADAEARLGAEASGTQVKHTPSPGPITRRLITAFRTLVAQDAPED